MKNMSFSLILMAEPDKLFKVMTDYENLRTFLPNNIKSMKIIETNANKTVTVENLVFNTIIKNEINQRTVHTTFFAQKIQSEIISGPAKGTIINITYEKVETGTKITITTHLALSLKAKIFSPLIKKMYKQIITGILYKMNTKAMML